MLEYVVHPRMLQLLICLFTSVLLYSRNEDWWYARHTDPKYSNKDEGYVPRNYVALEDTLESQE